MALAPPRTPAHHLHAISLLAYLGADEDGRVSVEDEPDGARKAERTWLSEVHRIADRATEGTPLEGDAASALALVSAAVDLLDAASVDAQEVGSRDVDRRFRRVRRHLLEIVSALEPAVRLDALEAEVERLRVQVQPGIAGAAARQWLAEHQGEPLTAPLEPEVPVAEPDHAGLNLHDLRPAPTPIADFPVGTITIDKFGEPYVRVRLPAGWDIAVGFDGDVYSASPNEAYSPCEGDTVIRIGDGTVPDSWLGSHAEVAEIARAWLAEHRPAAPPEPATTPAPESAPSDVDDDEFQF